MASLQLPKQVSRIDSRFRREWRRLYFAGQPNQWLIPGGHVLTICQNGHTGKSAPNSAMNLPAFLLKCRARRKRLPSHLTGSGDTVRAAGYFENVRGTPICQAGVLNWERYRESAAFRSYQNTSQRLDVQREFARSAAIETRRNDAIAPIQRWPRSLKSRLVDYLLRVLERTRLTMDAPLA